MDILLIMAIGIVIGNRFLTIEHIKINEKIQMFLTLTLIFIMGIGLGRKDDLIAQLMQLGTTSFIFYFIPTFLSIVIVYLLTKKFLR